MDTRLQRAVVAMLLTLPGTGSPYLYSLQPLSAAPGARITSDGIITESVWSFPIKQKIPVVTKKTSATRVSPNLYARQLWPAEFSARDRSKGLMREGAWNFPYKYERIPVVAKRTLEARVNDPCNGNEVTQKTRQSLRDNCEDAATTPATTTHLPSYRPLKLGGRWPRPFSDDTRLDFLGVLAAVGIKIIMSTALASWFLVAGQLLFAIADITGSSEIFGNGSPLSFIFRALPLVEILLRGSSTFDS